MLEVSYVLCDIDGTLANIDHRLHHISNFSEDEFWKADWKSFFEESVNDRVRQDTIDYLRQYTDNIPNCKLIIVTARPDNYRDITEAWLEKIKEFGLPDFEKVLMRKTGDRRDDTEIKRDFYENELKDLKIRVVFDDRPRVIEMWQSLGLNVIDCAL